MMSGRFGAVRRDVLRLFEGESVAGLGDGELLGRFADRRDEAAFEALVSRLGPMVLGVCRRMLADPHDVDDAFQATFLVLVRRAGSIRERDLVASWLHGVATKVARRARADSARRAARERVAVVETAREEGAVVELERPELRALIDEEIGRLSENHRRAVVLCDVEGLSREEAALKLGWSVNMVRGRLERARDRLRGRLARRGLAPSGAWAALLVAPPTPSPALLAATTRAALAFSAGRMGTGLASASAVALSRGVMRMMMYSKLKIGLAVLLSTSFVAAGSSMLAAQGPGDTPRAKPKVEAPPVARDVAPGAGDLKTLGRSRIEMARRRYQTQQFFYKEGRITVDRLMDASRTLMEAELDAARDSGERSDAIRAHLVRVTEVERRETADFKEGRSTAADVEEVQTRRLDAEYLLARESRASDARGPAAVPRPSLDQERVEIARRLSDEARKLYLGGEASIEEALGAAILLAKAEEGAARSGADRIVAIRNQVDRLKGLMAAQEELVKKGLARRSDVDRARLRLLDAEAHLLDVSGGTTDEPGQGVAPVPGGPTLGPATDPFSASPLANPKVRPESPPAPGGSLEAAIRAFNAEAARDEFGRDQPPLTVDEVIAAIRIWKPGEGEVASKELTATLDSISESRRWPEGADLSSLTQKFNGKDFFFFGWWVVIRVPGMDKTRGVSVREHLIRSVTYEEALAKAEADLKGASSPAAQSRLEKSIRYLKQKILEKKIVLGYRAFDRLPVAFGPTARVKLSSWMASHPPTSNSSI